MADYSKLKKQVEYLKRLSEENNVTIFVPTQARNPSRGRPYTYINSDLVIIDYPDTLR